MRNVRTLMMLLVAALAGLAAVVLASRWMVEQSAGSTVKVAVANTDINLGQRLAPEFVKLVEWPRESLPPGTLSDLKTVDGRVTKASVMRGEPILESKLTPAGTKGGLSAVIAEGKRAITVRVNDVVGVAGFALPGSFVDIIVNTQKAGMKTNTATEGEQSISKIVLEKILVLAVAQEVNRDETKPKVVNAVTLEVSPEEAEKLDLARSVGSLSLVLRNQVEARPVETAGATKRSLLNEPAIQAAAPATPIAKAIQVVHRLVERKVNTNCVGVISGMQQDKECF
ncbi:Flp pilus assembly protein CpaB [Cupriavidus pauculus]|uniref:Flp pilus assembly protein CpaB n=1 Tax=Cupriavidus pauculus TaxID=82633 RepID=UPI0007845335|nr:Flp pilus assembly protein CpaB [Cupriavidus pauculus]MBY4731048.1 Flp pilus assembly protein CpaB [Cupriavidus pauculus]